MYTTELNYVKHPKIKSSKTIRFLKQELIYDKTRSRKRIS